MPVYDPEQAKREEAANLFAKICKSQGIESTTAPTAVNLVLRMAIEALKSDDNARNAIECIMTRNSDVYHWAGELFDEYDAEEFDAELSEAAEQKAHERFETAKLHI